MYKLLQHSTGFVQMGYICEQFARICECVVDCDNNNNILSSVRTTAVVALFYSLSARLLAPSRAGQSRCRDQTSRRRCNRLPPLTAGSSYSSPGRRPASHSRHCPLGMTPQ